MAINNWGIMGQPRGSYALGLRDPRHSYAQQLMQMGVDASPVQHWTQGAARLASALMGGAMMRGIQQDQDDREQAASGTLSKALQAMRPRDAQGPMEGTGTAGYQIPGDMGQAAQIMAGNPDLQSQAWQLQLQADAQRRADQQREQDRQFRLEDRGADQDFRREMMTEQQGFQEKMQRERLALENKKPKGEQWVLVPNPAGADLPPVLMDQNTGNMKAIPGLAGQSKPMTEGQANAALYADRMRAAEEVVADPKLTEAGTSLVDRALGSIPLAGNYLVSDEYQKLDQAQRDFINAVLRRESGAAIASSEFDNARRQYFPQPGDNPDVLAQKAANRRTALEGISRAAGPNYKPTAPKAKQPDSGGIKFMGFE